MKNLIRIAAVIFLLLIGVASVFMTTSVLFDLFGIREMEGNYVEFVVIANLIAGVFYLAASYGMLKRKSWSIKLLVITAALLTMTFIGLMIHISSDGIYEPKTIKALAARTLITVALAVISSWTINHKIQIK